VPIFLELCLLGLAASQQVLPSALVLLLVGIAGIAPIVWMQWQRPFNIFSLLLLSLKPDQLTEPQRQILQQFKAPIVRIIAVVVAVAACLLLWQLNRWVPFVVSKAPIVPGGSFGGLLLAALAFLLAHLFLQVPGSVLAVLLTPATQLRAATPYPVGQIAQDFTAIGLPVQQILPPVVPSPAPVAATSPATPVSQVSQEPSSPKLSRSIQPPAPPPARPEIIDVEDFTISLPPTGEPAESLIADSESPLVHTRLEDFVTPEPPIADSEAERVKINPEEMTPEPSIIDSETELINIAPTDIAATAESLPEPSTTQEDEWIEEDK
jgi:hypothetical protein